MGCCHVWHFRHKICFCRFTCEISQTCNSESWLATGAIVLDFEKRNKYSCLPAASFALYSAHECGFPMLCAPHATVYFHDHLTLAVVTWYLSVNFSLLQVIFLLKLIIVKRTKIDEYPAKKQLQLSQSVLSVSLLHSWIRCILVYSSKSENIVHFSKVKGGFLFSYFAFDLFWSKSFVLVPNMFLSGLVCGNHWIKERGRRRVAGSAGKQSNYKESSVLCLGNPFISYH